MVAGAILVETVFKSQEQVPGGLRFRARIGLLEYGIPSLMLVAGLFGLSTSARLFSAALLHINLFAVLVG